MFGLGVEPQMFSKAQLVEKLVVQKEIKFRDEQKAKWEKAKQTSEPLTGPIGKYHEYRTKPPEQRDPEVLAALMEEAKVAQAGYFDRRERALASILDRSQNARLDQLQMQIQGPRAFRRQDVQQRLYMGEDQILVILEIVASGDEAIQVAGSVPKAVAPPRTGVTAEQRKAHLEQKENKAIIQQSRQAVIKAKSRTMQAIIGQLNKRQRAIYQAMVGEPFDFTKPPNPPGPAGEEKPKPSES